MRFHAATLPQMGDRKFLTDGGLETTLIFHDGLELPHFAAFDLLKTTPGRAALKAYYKPYIAAAAGGGYGFILDSATWRASRDWGDRLGYARHALAAANRQAIEMLVELEGEHAAQRLPMVINGAIGPRGDGYVVEAAMTPAEARLYHEEQIGWLADTAADMVTAYTMTHAAEAAGIALAARAAGMPCAISFTLETDGRLPSGEALADAIAAVDEISGGTVAYYMINCAHPTHFRSILTADAPFLPRLRGIRANASVRSHQELNEAADLDAGDPADLARHYAEMTRQLPSLSVLGGCCGTDHRHIAAIGASCGGCRAAA
ncbi:MAG: homocysteine S-methyltransferase family protein [Hyphomicrobiaceae bacterium]|nr:homocysteine S-methyltransferase family protein [Hyphomicrobiaceae bacterium]